MKEYKLSKGKLFDLLLWEPEFIIFITRHSRIKILYSNKKSENSISNA